MNKTTGFLGFRFFQFLPYKRVKYAWNWRLFALVQGFPYTEANSMQTCGGKGEAVSQYCSNTCYIDKFHLHTDTTGQHVTAAQTTLHLSE